MNDYERKKRRDDQGEGWRDDPIGKCFYCARRCLLRLRGGFVVDPMVPSTDPTVVLLASDGVFAGSPTAACVVKQRPSPELRRWKGLLQVVPREPVVLGDVISTAGWKDVISSAGSRLSSSTVRGVVASSSLSSMGFQSVVKVSSLNIRAVEGGQMAWPSAVIIPISRAINDGHMTQSNSAFHDSPRGMHS